MSLHEAIITVLRANKNIPMPYDEIATKINEEKLFVRPSDNSPVQAFQIRLRTLVSKSYKHHFIVKDDKVKLAEYP